MLRMINLEVRAVSATATFTQLVVQCLATMVSLVVVSMQTVFTVVGGLEVTVKRITPMVMFVMVYNHNVLLLGVVRVKRDGF